MGGLAAPLRARTAAAQAAPGRRLLIRNGTVLPMDLARLSRMVAAARRHVLATL
jgi:hypothetical protein